MATIHFTTTTTATPEQFTTAVTDFGPGRSELFGNTDDSQLKVHDRGPDWADVTEGKGPAWERLRYDWSDPNRIRMTTTDSNTWGGASGHTYTFQRQADGTTTPSPHHTPRDAHVSPRPVDHSPRHHSATTGVHHPPQVHTSHRPGDQRLRGCTGSRSVRRARG